MEAFRIGEFAKLNDLSVQLLKYYDQQGIMPPYWKDASGRYYVDAQSITLLELRYLSGMGLSLKEAQKLQAEGTLEDWFTHLSQAPAVIEREIREQEALLRFVKNIRDYLEQIRQKMQWRVEPWEGGKFLTKEYASLSHPSAWWKTSIPIPEVWQRITLPDPLNANDIQRHWGTLLPKDSPEDTEQEDMIPNGLCFVYVHSISKYDDYASERLNDQTVDFREPLKIMKEHNLKPRGILFQRWLCTTHEKEGEQVQVVTRIPLQQDAVTI